MQYLPIVLVIYSPLQARAAAATMLPDLRPTPEHAMSCSFMPVVFRW